MHREHVHIGSLHLGILTAVVILLVVLGRYAQ